MAGGARMMAARRFNVSRNSLDGGPIPAAWQSPTLEVMDLSFNRVPGSLPAQWGAPTTNGQPSAFPALRTFNISGNEISGAPALWAVGFGSCAGAAAGSRSACLRGMPAAAAAPRAQSRAHRHPLPAPRHPLQAPGPGPAPRLRPACTSARGPATAS